MYLSLYSINVFEQNICRNVNVFCPILAEQNERMMMTDSDVGTQHSTCERQNDWYSQLRLIWFSPALGRGLRKRWFVMDCNDRWHLEIWRFLVDKDVNWFMFILSYSHMYRNEKQVLALILRNNRVFCSCSFSLVCLVLGYSLIVLWVFTFVLLFAAAHPGCTLLFLLHQGQMRGIFQSWRLYVFCCVRSARLIKNIRFSAWFRIDFCVVTQL